MAVLSSDARSAHIVQLYLSLENLGVLSCYMAAMAAAGLGVSSLTSMSSLRLVKLLLMMAVLMSLLAAEDTGQGRLSP